MLCSIQMFTPLGAFLLSAFGRGLGHYITMLKVIVCYVTAFKVFHFFIHIIDLLSRLIILCPLKNIIKFQLSKVSLYSLPSWLILDSFTHSSVLIYREAHGKPKAKSMRVRIRKLVPVRRLEERIGNHYRQKLDELTRSIIENLTGRDRRARWAI